MITLNPSFNGRKLCTVKLKYGVSQKDYSILVHGSSITNKEAIEYTINLTKLAIESLQSELEKLKEMYEKHD